MPALTFGAADGHFTISNYNAGLTYAVTGATRSGSDLSAVNNGATITASYAPGAPVSAAATMNVLAHGCILEGASESLNSTGCGPRPGDTCSVGVLDTAGNTYAGPGTRGDFCGGACPGNCYGRFATCYYYHWTDYSGSGYSLIGNTWGKVT